MIDMIKPLSLVDVRHGDTNDGENEIRETSNQSEGLEERPSQAIPNQGTLTEPAQDVNTQQQEATADPPVMPRTTPNPVLPPGQAQPLERLAEPRNRRPPTWARDHDVYS